MAFRISKQVKFDTNQLIIQETPVQDILENYTNVLDKKSFKWK